MKKLTDMLFGQLQVHLENGMTQQQVAKKLGLTQCMVSRALAKYAKYGSLQRLPVTGRCLAISCAMGRTIRAQLVANSKTSLREMSTILFNKHGVRVQAATIMRWLNRIGIVARTPIYKPLLTPRHIAMRFEAAIHWLTLSEEKLEMIVWSDESKFNLRYNDGRKKDWCFPNATLESRSIVPTVKFGGGSVMVWGCFTPFGVGRLVFIEGTMNAGGYVDILSRNLLPFVREMGLSKFIFQQDNDPKHTSRAARHFFDENNIELLPWPAQSPDMNPIENLWGYMKPRVAAKRPETIEELKAAIQACWNELTPEICKKYALSFRKRTLALYNAKGKHTKY